MAPIRSAFPPPAAYTALSAGKSSSLHPARAAHDTGPTLAGLPPRRATPHRRAALSAAVTGHRSRPASAAVPGLSAPSAQTDRISAKQPRKRGCFCDRFVLSLQKTDGTSAKQPRKRGCFCDRFVLSLQKTDGTSAKQPRTRGCFCPRFVLSLRRIRSFFVSV